MAIFKSSVSDALSKLQKGVFASSEERDALLATLTEAGNLKPREVVWMLFRPDRAIRNAGVELLRANRSLDTADAFLVECKGKPEAALRAAAAILFELRIQGLEQHLAELMEKGDKDARDAVRAIVLGAPPSQALTPMLWKLAEVGSVQERVRFLDRLAAHELDRAAFQRWMQLAKDGDAQIRERALIVLAEKAPKPAVDLIVKELPRASYTTQQHLIAAVTRVAQSEGPEFADRILPLMAAGDAATRSAVIKILLGMADRRELVKRYLIFSKTLAGWARDRALDSMKEFGDDLIEPTIELLSDADDEVRGAALVVAGSFHDARIVPATIELLKDPDWWLRVTAADTLGRLGDQRAVPALMEALDDAEARWAAVEALGRIGDPRSLNAFGKLLKDPAPEVRIEVLLAFRNFKHPKILEVLKQVAASDPDRYVRGRALEIAEEVAQREHTEIAEAEAWRSEALKVRAGAGEPKLHGLLVATRNMGASDFHLAVDCPPMVRVASDLVRVKGDIFTAETTGALLKEVLTEDQWARLEAEQQLDLCYFIPKAGRYRANVFLDQRGLNAVFRVIPEQPPTITEIGLPPQLAEIATFHQGLVLICGPSGSGKSTTLAALVNLFNETRHDHVITLEDPVEFVHPFKNCLINQREVGGDTSSFARALRAALREDPDVIVIGDLRDNESVGLALTAAETGHIVLGTLSSTNAAKAVDRLISSFPVQEQPQIRASLSESLKYVVAQRLIPAGGERRMVACFEVLKGTFSVASMIRDEKTYQLASAMQIGRTQGMQTFDDALRGLLRAEIISAEAAYMYADKKDDFESLVSNEFLEAQTYV